MSEQRRTAPSPRTVQKGRGITVALAVVLLAVLSLLLVSVLLILHKDGPTPLHTKEELSSLVSTVSVEGKSTVTDCLRAWEFYDFDSGKLKRVESTFRTQYYKELPAVSALAEQTALTFLDTYYDTVDFENTASYTDALIASYVLSVGDRYAVYRTSDEYQLYSGDMSGSYVGIGVTVEYSRIKETMTVTLVSAGGPAEEAGIRVGDLIYAVNGAPVSELGYTETVNTIRGEEGTSLSVTVLREGEELTFSMLRRAFTEETVLFSMGEDGIAYIRITQFKLNTGTQFISAMDRAEEMGARAVIFDLRSNTGGYLTAVTEALDILAPKGETIVSFGDYAQPIVSKSERRLTLPAAVLCNGYTASAAELFTAALRDYADLTDAPLDVTVIGTVTYKKGVMQNTYTLSDGSTLTLTVAEYNPPSGKNYDGEGILPDRIVENTDSGNDRQRTEAERLLREKLAAQADQ